MAEKDLIHAKFSAQKLQHVLQETGTALRQTEDELSDFLQEYYDRVGGYMKQLLELRQELRALECETFTRQPHQQYDDPFFRLPPDKLRDAVRDLYRELARDCHPDLNGTSEGNDERMKALNAAYNERSLSTLWRLKWEMMQEQSDGQINHKQRLDLYKAQTGQMRESLEALEKREEALKQSDAWKLMQHAQFIKISGQDFMELAEQRMLGEIAQTKESIARSRRQQHYWNVMKRKTAAAAG